MGGEREPFLRKLLSLPISSHHLRLELQRARRTGERERVADIGNTGEHHDEALEAHAKPGMRNRAETAQIQVPPIVCGILIHLADTAFEHVEALLALAAADEFADAGNQYVHRGHGLTVVVLAHIERLISLG